MSITKEEKTQAIADFQRTPEDSGSPEVQISILTGRINNLTEHMKKHSKDFSTRRGLLSMVSRRRRLLDYLKKTDPQKYLDLLARLGIRK